MEKGDTMIMTEIRSNCRTQWQLLIDMNYCMAHLLKRNSFTTAYFPLLLLRQCPNARILGFELIIAPSIIYYTTRYSHNNH